MTDLPSEPTVETSGKPSRKARGPQRTCVGCGQEDAPPSMVRLVVSPAGEVAVDLVGSGRGAYVHPTTPCLALAPRGLTKSFRHQVDTSPARLAALVETAVQRRIGGLVGSAIRSRQVVLGAESAGMAWQNGRAELLVVARDAAAGALLGSVKHAVAEGDAVAWGTKAELGNLVGRAELGVVGITSRSIAEAVRSAMGMVSSAGAREAMQKQSPAGGAVATEDR
jgi:predicted RNA-binding protein YlxR (DUF448 family)/ribosomal protein L30E